MPITNQAFVFIKPHAVGHAGVNDLIAEKLKTSGIRVIRQGIVTAARMADEGLIDQHYVINARAATCDDPTTLRLSDKARATFEQHFGTTWQAACESQRLCSATTMQARLGGISGEQLSQIWTANGLQKVAGGLYVSYFKEQDCYVLNGFYPAVREDFTAPGRTIRWMLLQFDGNQLPWATFRAHVIGTTNPAKADPHSIRGMGHAQAEEFGLRVGYRHNIIHASASPFEALVEQICWLKGFTLDQDPLGSALAAKGIDCSQLLAWRDANPWVAFEGREGKLIDVAEDRDTPAVYALLKQLQKKKLTNG